jgi:hypothetical protein
MIEVDNGDYFIGKMPEEALCQAQTVYPEEAFYSIRIGYKAARKLKSRALQRYQSRLPRRISCIKARYHHTGVKDDLGRTTLPPKDA